MKKKRFSPLKFLVTVICLVAIASSVIINVSFAKSEVPKFYDRYVYVVGESNPLEGDITTGAALIAKDASDISIASGDIVLCYPSDNPSVISLRSINAVVEGDDGSESYYTRDNFHEDNTESIPKQSIVAVCTGYPESLELGRFIVFTRDMKGIIAEFIAPCILLVILLIAGIISSKGSDDDDENILYEYDEEEKEQSQQQARKNAHVKQSNTPLYDPASDIRPSEELNKKQMSIAENFSQKKVDHDSPYQKEKERTMQFKAQRNENTGKINTVQNPEPAPIWKSPENIAKESENRNEIKNKENNLQQNTSPAPANPVQNKENATDITGVISKSQVEEMSRETKPRPAPKPVEHISTTPDISDILSKTETQKKKKAVSNLSVDELLKMIEDEQKKL